MIKAIGNSESISSSFDNLLSNMNNRETNFGVSEPESKVEKKKNDEFIQTIDSNKLESEISKLLEEETLKAKFSIDEDTNKMILTIVDRKTEEVVKQYPPEVSLKIARMVNEMIENNSVKDARV
ncbi:MAG: flagellar protein FlaG [Chlorobiota bacterium]